MGLPLDIDFTKDPSASPSRMDRMTAHFDGRLRALEVPARGFDQVLAGLQTIGLTRIADALAPVYAQAAALRDQLDAVLAAYVALGLPAARIVEGADLVFLTAARRAAILADALAQVRDGVDPAGNSLAKLYGLMVALKGNADAAHDSLGELAALIDANATAIGAKADAAATTAALNNRVRTDADSSPTPEQARQGRANILAPDLSALAMMNIAVNGFGNVSAEKGATATTLTATGTPAAVYVVDQQTIAAQGSMVVQGAQVASPFPSCPLVPYGTKVTVTTPQAALGANDFLTLNFPTEANRIARLGWGSMLGVPLTVGVMIRPSLPLVIGAWVDNGATATRRFIRRVSCPANVDTFVPLRFDPEPTGVWAKDNTLGMNFSLTLAAGASRLGSTDVWLPGVTLLGGVDQGNLAAAAGNSVIVSGLVMLPGIVPLYKETLPFLARHAPQEVDECLRYYFSPGITGDEWCFPLDTSNNYRALQVNFPKQMRIAPNVSAAWTNLQPFQSGYPNVIATQYWCRFRADMTANSIARPTSFLANSRL